MWASTIYGLLFVGIVVVSHVRKSDSSVIDGKWMAHEKLPNSGINITYAHNNQVKHNRFRRESWYIHARSCTKTVTRGNNVQKKTTVYYFHSKGDSFKFTINDDLPVDRSELIDWIESNKNRFSLTHIPYEPQQSDGQPCDSEEPQEHYIPYPTSLPTAATQMVHHFGLPGDDMIIPQAPQCGQMRHYVQNKIAFGEETEIEKTPWQAGIFKVSDGKLLCGGSIITKRHIVTAAHCFKGSITPTRYKVTVGTDLIENIDMDELYQPFKIYVHKRYDRNHKRNDIAVILLRETLVFSNQIFPICLPALDISYRTGHTCTAGGWGGTEDDQGTQHSLRTVRLRITDHGFCKSTYAGRHEISGGMFCAEGTNSRQGDTCGGDSGGPLACDDNGYFYLYGITSFGDVGVCEGKPDFLPGVYVTVSRYREWISQQIKKYRKTYGCFIASTLTARNEL